MSRDYSYEIYSLRQQISTMSSERADILNKISILKQNKSKIQSKKSAISERLSQYDLIKAKATSNFAGNRRDDFNNKIETLKGSISQWLENTQNNIDLIDQKISTYTAEASNLAIGMNYASQSLNTYIYLQSQNED
ncbi:MULTISPECIES: YwqH-like family protein [Streptococcus]|uniref:YwqH-like family protein n=1 Tax=Streptococcus TaxID=1301 RepID=UPI00025AA793|nr:MULTISPECIES: DUF5082 family protein [Streptococcus]EID25068.1 hypothetical protein HMPREF1047_1224 [Streptococcus oralis SK1074]EJO20138.1 hypothetical protein HMPREF1149_1783 [Streptococcus sp. BS35b]ETS89169.1 hypothetical protein HMPREF1513_1445 [Streptococcus sp. BS29a]EUB29828.1 hypothetical protein HMPREF1515_1665 [Streptococcus sp. BS21]MCY7105359.1 DUF5082 domain-containing protein [Streptococcus oralis]